MTVHCADETETYPSVLLVDDEKGYAEVLARRMDWRGIHVVLAFNGTDAIQTLRDSRFDVAILDLKMDDMDGLEVLKIFKKMDPVMPVIILTGHGSETDAQEGIALGAFDWVFKPCDFKSLMDKVSLAIRIGR